MKIKCSTIMKFIVKNTIYTIQYCSDNYEICYKKIVEIHYLLLVVWKLVKRTKLLVLCGTIELCFHWKKMKMCYVLIQDIRLLSFKSKEILLFMLGAKLRQKNFVKGQIALQVYYIGVFGEVIGGTYPLSPSPSSASVCVYIYIYYNYMVEVVIFTTFVLSMFMLV